MQIIHISDLHLNSFYNETIIPRLNYLLNKLDAERIDHLVITGDLTDNAAEKDFNLLRQLLKRFNFLDGSRLTIIVGNHDIFGGVQRAEDIFSFPEKCSTVNYNKKLDEFTSYFPEALENCFYISPKRFYPFAKIVNDVLILGINSIAHYSKINNPFASNGEISVMQFSEINELLKSCPSSIKYKLVAIHHHFNKYKLKAKSSFGSVWQSVEKRTMKLKNKRRLFNLFQEHKVDLVLHGHLHESKEYFRKGIKFSNAGASFKNESDDTVLVNYLKLDNKKISVNIKQLKTSEKNSTDAFIFQEYMSYK